MTPRSVRDLVLLAPRPLRKFIRYRMLPKGIATRLGSAIDEGRNPLRTFWSKKRAPGASPVKSRNSKWYEDRLWRGFSEDSLVGLEMIKLDPRSSTRQVAKAASTIAVWYASHGDYERAHQEVVLARAADPDRRRTKLHTAVETECLFAKGENEMARHVVDEALLDNPNDPCLLLTRANTLARIEGSTDLENEDERLEWINRVFKDANLSLFRRKDRTRALAFDNIEGIPSSCYLPIDKQPLVSVLVPAHCAEETLRATLESVLSQTWKNLEIIVVDDKSSDGTFELAQLLSQEDPRITAYCLPENRGAYAARNEALRRARGEYVTIHDADDWSHPQKIELQMRHLLENPSVPANCSDWVRCRFNLFFRGNVRISVRRINLNYSSILLKREIAIAFGGWDEVRAGADNEFIRRLERSYGIQRIARVSEGIPLSFGLELPSSLTRSKVSHVLTLFHGVRRTYHEASAHWLETRGAQANWVLPAPSEGRAFPAPYELTRQLRPAYDLLVIMDYGLHGGAFVSTLNYIQAAIDLGKRVAVFHWRRFDLHPIGGPGSKILELAQTGQLYILPPGGSIEVDTVIAGYPPVLNSRIDLPPNINPKRFFIVTNQMYARLYSGGDVQYDPSRISQNVINLFGITPTWIPISNLVRQLMVADGRYDPIHHETWTPLIETRTWFSERVTYRGQDQAQPVIGRHARDHYTKWPQSADTIRQAYCADTDVEVQLMGGAKIPKRLIGSIPANWTVHDFGTLEARTFLLGLDFYIHYPHEDYIEEFGRAVLEAMAVGLPVILPPVFEPTFREAALYAEPHEVRSSIERIWKNEDEWQARSDASIRFVQSHGDWAQLASRLTGLTT